MIIMCLKWLWAHQFLPLFLYIKHSHTSIQLVRDHRRCSPTPLAHKGQQEQAAQDCGWISRNLKVGNVSASQGNLFQGMTKFTLKSFFLIYIYMEFLVFQFMPTAFCPFTGQHLDNRFPSETYMYWSVLLSISLCPMFYRINSPSSSSLSLYDRCFNTLFIFLEQV